MPEFPEEMSFKLIEDVYIHYSLTLFDLIETMYVYCEWCDEVVCKFEYERVKGLQEEDLYTLILTEHQEIVDA